MSGFEITNKMDAASKTTTPDIEKIMRRLHTACPKKFHLKRADLIPHSADIFPMLVSVPFFRAERLPVFAHAPNIFSGRFVFGFYQSRPSHFRQSIPASHVSGIASLHHTLKSGLQNAAHVWRG